MVWQRRVAVKPVLDTFGPREAVSGSRTVVKVVLIVLVTVALL